MSQTDRPNILIFMSDQHSPRFLGCYGNELVRTPNLDRLADQESCQITAQDLDTLADRTEPSIRKTTLQASGGLFDRDDGRVVCGVSFEMAGAETGCWQREIRKRLRRSRKCGFRCAVNV